MRAAFFDTVSIQDKLQNKLPFINPRAKSLIEELYENLKILPEEQNQQREMCTKLLNEIIDSLIDNLLSVEDTIYETQIDTLLNQTKLVKSSELEICSLQICSFQRNSSS
jgi:DNA-binding transcriptional regulator GbsR (MarR family)